MGTTLDVKLFWVAFACYGFGWLAYSFWLGLRKPILTKLGTTLFVLGIIPQTIAFGLRWANTGHFPLSNMYEYLAVMSWMAAISLAFLTWRYRHWVISALISPVVVMLMVAASLLPKEPSMQLMPALQSYWLMIHVSLASIGAGAFAVAAAVSMIYLFAAKDKDEEKAPFQPKLKAPAISLVAIPALMLIIGGAAGLFSNVTHFGFFGDPSGGMGSAVILCGMYLPLAGFVWARLAKGEPGPEQRYWAAVGFLALFIGALVTGFLIRSDRIALTTDSPLKIFEFFGVTLICSAIALFVVHALLGFGKVPAKLHLEGKLLDEINYRAVTLGYPLYTLGALFAGAIWAEQAWGAFWSWDPKEVGALIIWLFYSAFLHARYQRGWSGSRTALLSLVGFAMMMLSFFGNYFFGGLHSYGLNAASEQRIELAAAPAQAQPATASLADGFWTIPTDK
ncbi:MAG TPA: cytochrome c biogenesis protein CcsA [bacterium]|jgi:ABC-type transport system involved in cytochrome c biogenesis permease subunit